MILPKVLVYPDSRPQASLWLENFFFLFLFTSSMSVIFGLSDQNTLSVRPTMRSRLSKRPNFETGFDKWIDEWKWTYFNKIFCFPPSQSALHLDQPWITHSFCFTLKRESCLVDSTYMILALHSEGRPVDLTQTPIGSSNGPLFQSDLPCCDKWNKDPAKTRELLNLSTKPSALLDSDKVNANDEFCQR